MSWLPNPIACDVCGVLKQPSNHWYYASVVFTLGDGQYPYPHFTLWHWDDRATLAVNRDQPWLHLCGQVCAIRKLNDFMSMGSSSATSTEPPSKDTGQSLSEPASNLEPKPKDSKC